MTPDPNSADERLVDAGVDRAWREHSREMPSAELDTAILAAAHRAAGAGPRDPALAEAREPERWWWPLAAAAVIGAIAFGVIQLVPHERSEVDAVVSDVPRTIPGAPSVAPAPPPAPAAKPDPVTGAAPAAEPKAIDALPAPLAKQRREALPESVAKNEAAAARRDAASGKDARGAPAERAQRAERQAREMPSPPPVVQAPPAAPAAPEPAGGPRPFPAQPSIAQAPAAPPVAAEAKRGDVPAPAASPPPPSQEGASTAADSAEHAPVAKLESGFAKSSPSTQRAPAPSAPTATGRVADAPGRDRAAPTALAGAATAVPALTPEQWIERIRTLRRDGRDADAATALNAFRAAYPDADAKLPEELRAWAATVRRDPPQK